MPELDSGQERVAERSTQQSVKGTGLIPSVCAKLFAQKVLELSVATLGNHVETP
jgi:hypothetical protein